jgi:hypothetical protein
VTVSPELIDWQERRYLSQYSLAPLSLSIFIGGILADPDGQAVTGQIALQNPDGSIVLGSTYPATREQAGVYTITTSSADTAIPADAEIIWSYAIGGNTEQYITYIVIGPANPHYDNLPPEMKDFLETSVWNRFSDLFDSAGGGPNLQTYFQAHWSRGRAAQLMNIAVGKINTISQPWSNYSTDGVSGPLYPLQQWGGLLAQQTFCEMVKHLIRSYTEQPDLRSSGSITRLDRRDYTDRWREVLRDEQAELKSLLDTFKVRHMFTGSPKVLVSGGSYGRYSPTRVAGSVAARPRMWARWY